MKYVLLLAFLLSALPVNGDEIVAVDSFADFGQSTFTVSFDWDKTTQSFTSPISFATTALGNYALQGDSNGDWGWSNGSSSFAIQFSNESPPLPFSDLGPGTYGAQNLCFYPFGEPQFPKGYSDSYVSISPVGAPEPSTLAMLLSGTLLLLPFRRKLARSHMSMWEPSRT